MTEKGKPSKAIVSAAIDAIANLDLKCCTDQEILSAIEPLFDGFGAAVPYFDPPQYIYRGRVCPEKPKHLNELKYPPSEFAKKGRANADGQSMFYGSVGLTIPFYEIKAAAGDRLIVAVWKTTRRIELQHIGYTKTVAEQLKSSRNLAEVHGFVEQTTSVDELTAFVYNYLGEIFSREVTVSNQEYYRLTSAIATRLLKNKKIDGIIYPTIAMAGNADNIVLRPESVDNNLEFDYVQYIEINKNHNGDMTFKVLDSAVEFSDNGELIWTGMGLSWDIGGKEELSMRVGLDEWIAFDKDGNRIKPQAKTNLNKNASPLFRRFLNDFEECAKANQELNFTSSLGNVTVHLTVNVDLINQKKFLTLYVPPFQDTLGLVSAILNNLNNYLKLFDDVELHLVDEKSGNLIHKSSEITYNNHVYLYSENWFDRHLLTAMIPETIIGHLIFASQL